MDKDKEVIHNGHKGKVIKDNGDGTVTINKTPIGSDVILPDEKVRKIDLGY